MMLNSGTFVNGSKMSSTKRKGPIFDPGLCRCCGTMKKCRLLNVEYESSGQKEIYSAMMLDCFGLMLSHLDGKLTERLVCATCVTRLREACAFRRQVMACEEAYIQMRLKYDCDSLDVKAPLQTTLVEGAPPPYPMEVTIVKCEPPDLEDCKHPGSDGDAAADDSIAPMEFKPCMDENSMSNDDLPLKAVARGMVEPDRGAAKEEPPPPAPSPPSPSAVEKHKFWARQRKPTHKPKIPISTMQELIRQRDRSFMVETNVFAIVENSYICPFKCRHNNLLCYYCGANFTDPESLREHTATQHHPRKFKVHDHKNMIKFDVTRVDCRLCPTPVSDLEALKQHLVTVHGKKFYFEATDSVLPFKLVKDDMRCAVCNAGFPYFHALNKHMNEHFSNYVCETCGLGFVDNNRFVMHQARHEQGSYPCETCGKLFKSEYNRELHIDRVHHKRGRVYCPKCDVKLMSHPQKLKHLVEVHGETPSSLPCTYCDKIFDTRRNLTIHWRKEHLKDYRYDCQVCGQKFFTRFALNNHMPTHTGERNFKCKVCEKTYPRLKTLKEHTRIHTNDRRYRCHICGQAFIQNCSLKGHMKSQHPDYG